MALVLAFSRMMPRIEAGERLAAISDGAIAAGTMRPQHKDRAIRALEDAQAGRRRKATKATPALLAGMGIGTMAPSAASDEALSDG